MIHVYDMNRKLTLTIEDHVIEFAKSYARRTNRSISSMVEQYFSRLESEIEVNNLTPISSELYGAFESTPLPDKETMRRAFHEKDSH